MLGGRKEKEFVDDDLNMRKHPTIKPAVETYETKHL